VPAPIPASVRADIVYHAALGYTNEETAAAVGVSRNTVRKYLRLTRAVVEDADDPREALVDVVRNEYDWTRPAGPGGGFGDLPM